MPLADPLEHRSRVTQCSGVRITSTDNDTVLHSLYCKLQVSRRLHSTLFVAHLSLLLVLTKRIVVYYMKGIMFLFFFPCVFLCLSFRLLCLRVLFILTIMGVKIYSDSYPGPSRHSEPNFQFIHVRLQYQAFGFWSLVKLNSPLSLYVQIKCFYMVFFLLL